MKITHAVWEKRNIGVDAYEISIEKGDTFDDFLERQNEFPGEYIVVKIPSDMYEFTARMNKTGYRFIETAVACHINVDRLPELSPIQKRLLNNCSFSLMEKDDMTELQSRLDQGLFETDRIAVDPCFTVKQANDRYWGWINDALDRGALLYKVLYKQTVIGFFCIQVYGNISDAFLAGIYKEFQNKGFGSIVYYMEMTASKENNAAEMKSAFSTNNRGAFANHMSLGYILDRTEYVFIKHK